MWGLFIVIRNEILQFLKPFILRLIRINKIPKICFYTFLIMHTSLTIIRYRNRAIPLAFLSMALFHFPLWFSKKYSFYKLLGSGKNGTFDKVPDLNQWAILLVHKGPVTVLNNPSTLGEFISKWINLFAKESFTILMEPVAGHGKWDNLEPFGNLDSKNIYEGPVATLTRATIRLSKMKHFWQHVAPVAQKMKAANGYVFSIGIGEVPWIKQATFSVWQSVEEMKVFAYSMKEHREVVKKTRAEKWYSEDLFVRFRIIESFGTIRDANPLRIKS